jgi:hypothetical protein
MTLTNANQTFNRSAIFACAWGIARADARMFGGKLFKHQGFGFYLRQAWQLARKERALVADGTIARQQAAEAQRQAALARPLVRSVQQIAAANAWLIAQCATDGRVAA